jgi:dienelactone hydrolase
VREEVARFGSNRSIVAILHHAESGAAPGAPALLLANAGIVHRVGPHRLYVKLARRLAAQGHTVLRLDVSGLGDSPAAIDVVPFDASAVADVRSAMTFLENRLGVSRFVTAGICSGGKVAFDTALIDPRVVGVVPINSGLHLHSSTQPAALTGLARRVRARHYWRIALFSSFRRKSWRKALRRQLGVGDRASEMFRGLFPTWPDARGVSTEPRRRLDQLLQRGVRVLHVYSEGDEWLDYYRICARRLGVPNATAVRLEIVPAADHTFTRLWSQERLIGLVAEWLRLGGDARPASGSDSSSSSR